MVIEKATRIAAILTAAVGCAASGGVTASPAQQIPGRVYVYESDVTGFNTKTVFFDNGEEVVAVDAQFTPALAEKSLEFLKTKTQSPVRYLVITHPNPDKFNGVPVFQKAGAKVIASKATARAMAGTHDYKKHFFVKISKMFTEDSYPKLGAIDLTFDGTFDLVLKNKEKVSLRELKGPGVSSTQTVVSVPAVNALIVGDLVHHKAHAWLEGGIVGGKPTPTISSWIKNLEDLSRIFGKQNPIVYGGRGDAAVLEIVVPEQIVYLNAANKIVADHVKGLGSSKSELQGPNAGNHYAKIQKDLESRFPEYSLGYMIQYGVYGLALSN
jgi:glyoxylase-like metal-dependent hydrolase (beta-lactamase superfamily II)